MHGMIPFTKELVMLELRPIIVTGTGILNTDMINLSIVDLRPRLTLISSSCACLQALCRV